MDGSPLDDAYTASKHADIAVRTGDFAKAAVYYSQSADAYERVANQAADNPAVNTLIALAGQCRSRSHYFESGQALEDSKKSVRSASAAATQRDPQTPQTQRPAAITHQEPPSQPTSHVSVNGSVSLPMSNSVAGPPLSDAVTSLVMRSAAAFARTFDQSLAGKGVALPNISTAPTESFYLVRPKTSKHEDEDSSGSQFTISSLERAQAIERATKAQKSVLKSGLQHIHQEMAQKEQQINDEHTEEVDRLRAENDRLRIQVSKLKSRWEELKESARKRQS